MKMLEYYRPTLIAAGLLLASSVGTIQGDQVMGQEYIVGQEIVSDTVASAGTSNFVGDMNADEAGIEYEFSEGEMVGDLSAGCIGRSYGQPDLFYNFYTQGNCNTSNSQMYISPLPVPPNVGHTYFTYQPFYPHEMLYSHRNTFHRYYDGGRGMNRTRVSYSSPPVRQALSNLYWNYLRIPR